MPAEQPRIVLVHGFWNGSWCWASVVEGLAAAGRVVAAVDILGFGLNARRPASLHARPFDPAAFATEPSPVADVTVNAAADRLVGQLKRIGGGQPCVLVGHSMGGPVITAAAQRAPDLVAQLVYLTAFMPASGVAPLTYATSADNEGNLVLRALRADPEVVGALRLDVADPDPEYQQGLYEAFGADVDAAAWSAASALRSCDAPAVMFAETTTLTADAWGRVPRTYVICTEDYAIRPALQRRFVAEADAAFPDNPTSVVELNASHSAHLSMPDRVAEIILSL